MGEVAEGVASEIGPRYLIGRSKAAYPPLMRRGLRSNSANDALLSSMEA